MWPFSRFRKKKVQVETKKEGGNGEATDVEVARENQVTPVEILLADCEEIESLDSEPVVEDNTGEFPEVYNKPGIVVKEKTRAQRLHKHDSQSRRVLCDIDKQIERLKKIREKIKGGTLNGKAKAET